MNIRVIAVGSALVAGLGVAVLTGAGSAHAAPGISFDPGPGDPIGIGDNSVNGARATATGNNQALAISIFRPATAHADGDGTGINTAIAIDGYAGVTNGHSNSAVSIRGRAHIDGSNKSVLSIGSAVDSDGVGDSIVPESVAAICGQKVYGGDRYGLPNSAPSRFTVSGGSCL